ETAIRQRNHARSPLTFVQSLAGRIAPSAAGGNENAPGARSGGVVESGIVGRRSRQCLSGRPAAANVGTAYRIRTGGLRLERAVSWASRRMRQEVDPKTVPRPSDRAR